MFDEDLFNVFNETGSSAEKPGSQTESVSSRKNKYCEDKGNSVKSDNKR